MFNAYFYDQLTERARKAETDNKKHLKSLSAQLQFRDKLAVSNRKRVEKRIIDMSLDPVPINRHEQFMKFPAFKGESFIRSRPRDAKERIRDAELESKWLDTVPLLPSPHDFRPRLKGKEINPDMKYRPKDRYERVAEAWLSQDSIIDHTWEIKGLDPKNEMPKVFPNTVKRSYYKTVESVALGLRKSEKTASLPHVTHDVSNDLPEVSKTERNITDIAQETMEKCRLKPLKEELRSVYTGRSSSIQHENRILVKKIV
jgi:hypothetical protein